MAKGPSTASGDGRSIFTTISKFVECWPVVVPLTPATVLAEGGFGDKLDGALE